MAHQIGQRATRRFWSKTLFKISQSRKGQDIFSYPVTWIILLLLFILMVIFISGAGKDSTSYIWNHLIRSWGG